MATASTKVSEMNAVNKPIRIAILDDDEEDFLIIEEYIRAIPGREFQVDWYGNYEDAITQVRGRHYDLYFVDYFLGHKTGLELLQEAASLDFDKPIVLLTGLGSRAIDISAMENGATDYLAKGEINSEKLERCIRYSLDRAHILEKLKTREAMYRNLFERSRDGVFISDMDLNIREANPSVRIMLKVAGMDWENTNIYSFIGEEAEKKRIMELIKNGQHIDDVEIKLNKGDEDQRNCLLSLSIQRDNPGGSTVHGIIRDITSSKKAQYTGLQSEKIEANERLVRMLTHEIRNPLNNIILSADQLLSNLPEEDKTDFISIIQRNAIRINNIITELLNHSSPADMVFSKEDLGELVKKALKSNEEENKKKNIVTELTLPQGPLSIVADAQKLVIALSNILKNAAEAMEEKGKLRVVVHSTEDYYTLSIRDNGNGIPAEFVPRVFDPFFTLKKNGVGLGLTAAYSILKSHKASVHVESKEGEGTLFMLSFSK